jgi:hypothetical protein
MRIVNRAFRGKAVMKKSGMVHAWMSPPLAMPGWGGYWIGVYDLSGPSLLMMFYGVRGEPGRASVFREGKTTVVEV